MGQLSNSLLQSSRTAARTFLIIRWFLLVDDLPPHWRPSFSRLKRLNLEPPKSFLNLRMTHCLILKSLLDHAICFWAWVPKFLAKLEANAMLNFLSHRQFDAQKTRKNRFWLIEGNWAVRAINNSRMCMEVQGQTRPTPRPQASSY